MPGHFKYDKLSEEDKNDLNMVIHDNISDEQIPNEARHSSRPGRSNGWHILVVIVGCHLLFNIFWTLALALTWESLCWSRSNEGPRLIPSPAREAVSYEVLETNSTVFTKNDFMGRPRPKQTKMWYDSYTKWANMVVSEQDIEAVNRSSIALADGSGYLATLEVFHQLHCLDYIRQYISKDYYITPETEQRRFEHMDHCIDTIRLGIMCHSDISLVTFDWVDDELLPNANFHVKHECRNFEAIRGWAKEHQANKAQIIDPYGRSLEDMLGHS
ncbi:hypothetical protein MMC30_008374 [Trapelia coarctata]|nr:hypothetical protein [Trapelia coarctata]